MPENENVTQELKVDSIPRVVCTSVCLTKVVPKTFEEIVSNGVEKGPVCWTVSGDVRHTENSIKALCKANSIQITPAGCTLILAIGAYSPVPKQQRFILRVAAGAAADIPSQIDIVNGYTNLVTLVGSSRKRVV